MNPWKIRLPLGRTGCAKCSGIKSLPAIQSTGQAPQAARAHEKAEEPRYSGIPQNQNEYSTCVARCFAVLGNIQRPSAPLKSSGLGLKDQWGLAELTDRNISRSSLRQPVVTRL